MKYIYLRPTITVYCVLKFTLRTLILSSPFHQTIIIIGTPSDFVTNACTSLQDLTERAEKMLEQAEKIDSRAFVTARVSISVAIAGMHAELS